MNASEASCLLESLRPKEPINPNYAEGIEDMSVYFHWLDSLPENIFYDTIRKENKIYGDPFHLMGRGEYLGKCQYCGQEQPPDDLLEHSIAKAST